MFGRLRLMPQDITKVSASIAVLRQEALSVQTVSRFAVPDPGKAPQNGIDHWSEDASV
jgi:hypothetical protein